MGPECQESYGYSSDVGILAVFSFHNVCDSDHFGVTNLFFVFFFGIPFYLQTVRVHSANGVTSEACRGALSSTSPHLTGSKPCVSVGKMTY
jgi:hypothetical protein